MINVNKHLQLNFNELEANIQFIFDILCAVLFVFLLFLHRAARNSIISILFCFICRNIDGIPQLKRRSKIEFNRRKSKSVEIYSSRG